MIVKVLCAGPLETNAVVLALPGKGGDPFPCAIIDAPPGSFSQIQKIIRELNLSPQMVLLTHSHWDHIGDVAAIKEIYQIPIYVHEQDAANLRVPGSDGLPLFFEIQGVEPDHFIADGDEINLDTLKIQVIHTPGHSPGSVCYWLEEEALLLSGDTLFCGGIGSLSLPTARPSLMRNSLQKLLRLPAKTRVIPGHGIETTIRQEQERKIV